MKSLWMRKLEVERKEAADELEYLRDLFISEQSIELAAAIDAARARVNTLDERIEFYRVTMGYVSLTLVEDEIESIDY